MGQSSEQNRVNDIKSKTLSMSPLSGTNKVLKRVFDILLSVLFIIILTPLYLIAGVAIYISSQGPIVFQQWRYGLNNKPITILKFRTMNVCEDGYKCTVYTGKDFRVTKIGKFLRKYYIDETLQFINVLTGKMSIVGPRPHAITMFDEYSKKIIGARNRHIVKPGITGLAQLYAQKGAVNSLEDTSERIYYDLKYINEYSLFLDIKIIFLTCIFIIKMIVDNIYNYYCLKMTSGRNYEEEMQKRA